MPRLLAQSYPLVPEVFMLQSMRDKAKKLGDVYRRRRDCFYDGHYRLGNTGSESE